MVVDLYVPFLPGKMLLHDHRGLHFTDSTKMRKQKTARLKKGLVDEKSGDYRGMVEMATTRMK